MKSNILSSFVLLVFTIVVFAQCNKTEDPVTPVIIEPEEITDQELYDESTATSGFTYYKNDNKIQKSSFQSAHKIYFRTKFNQTAFDALTDDGKLPAGGTFSEGSVIVKELHDSLDGSAQGGIAVMKKLPNDPNAVDGWVWAEYFTGPQTGYSLILKGDGCISCHSAQDRDRVRLFELFP